MSVTSTFENIISHGAFVRLAIISSPLVCLGGSTRLNFFWATTMHVTSPSQHFLSHGGLLCLGTISSPLGSLHSAWIWQVHRPKISGAASMSVTLPHRLNTSYQGVHKGLYVSFVKDRTWGPPQGTISRPPQTAAVRHSPPTANRQRRSTANHQTPPNTINHQSPTTNRHHPLPIATNRRSPTANTWCACARGLFWKSCVMQHFFPPH